MKFRNKSSDELVVPTLGFSVAPDETTPDLTDEQAAGFLAQADVWSAVGTDAKAVQADVVQTEPVPDPIPTTQENAS